MAFLADQQGLFLEAQLLYQQALVIQQQHLGLYHSRVGLLLESYARVLHILGQPVEAGLFSARASSIRARLQTDAQQEMAPRYGKSVGVLRR